MNNIEKIGKVNSPNDDGKKYQVGLHSISGTVHIEIESNLGICWRQVGIAVRLTI